MLSGVRVLDFSNYIPGPFATLRLAELGAEIIKIESLAGDPARTTGNELGKVGPVYRAMNRGKKSITINLKKPEGKEIATQLIEKADVIIESFRPGVMEKLGLGYEAVKKIKQDIVYCSISGYGQQGSLSKLGSHDINYLALSGVLAQLKGPTGEPTHPSITFADYYGSFAANERILAGLVSKGLTGKGSYHSISITDVMTSLMGNHVIVAGDTGYQNGLSVLNGTIISYRIYKTKDDRYVSLGALEPKFWQNFCRAVDRLDWEAAHFSKATESNAVYLEVRELFNQKSLAEWTDFSRKVDCCLAPVLEVGEIKDHANGLVYNAEWGDEQISMHGDLLSSSMVPTQAQVVLHGQGSQAPQNGQYQGLQQSQTPPPNLGEHNNEILKELLNASDLQLDQWKEQGII